MSTLIDAATAGPVVVVSNHSAYWDPIVVIHLVLGHARLEGFAMMDAANLRRRPFFALVGGFGVDLTDARDGARAVRYAASLLNAPRRLVWIFPEGRERAVSRAPLDFKGGAAAVARAAPRSVTIPAAIRYVHASEPSPKVFVSFGAPLPASRDIEATRARQQRAVEAELGVIDDAITGGDGSAFSPLRSGGTRVSSSLSVGERALAAMTRPYVLTPERTRG